MPADFACSVLAGRMKLMKGLKTRKKREESDDPNPVWQQNADGSKTMRVNNMAQLMSTLPRKTKMKPKGK